MPADNHRRFRLLTTWDAYTKPKDKFYKNMLLSRLELLGLLVGTPEG